MMASMWCSTSWSLKEGHDLNSFMEQMVTDPAIKGVIVVSDAKYAAEKADARKGGVGTESQIISQEVYQKVDQEKFIPVVAANATPRGSRACRSFSRAGSTSISLTMPTTPSRMTMVFGETSTTGPFGESPFLGKVPAHLFDDNAVVIPAAQKGQRFRDVVTTGRRKSIRSVR